MDKLKKILSPGHEKDDELMYGTQSSSPPSATATGKRAGQGSHFGSTRDDTTEPPSATQPPTGISTTATGTADTPYSIMDNTRAEPTSSTTGEAAIGQTSTYGKYPLGTGDTTSSVIDPTSSDPTTYRKPEKDYEGRNRATSSGVSPGAAEAAATAAFKRHQGTGAGSTSPTSAVPHVATALPTDTNSGLGAGTETYPTELGTSRETAPGASEAGVAGLAGAATGTAWSGHEKKKVDDEMPGAFPTDDYVNPYKATSPLDPRVDNTPRNFSLPSSTTQTSAPVLGGAKTKDQFDENNATFGTTRSTTTPAYMASTSGDPSASSNTYSTIPTRSGPPPSHHRKESIPTTAYPSGTFSATSQPPVSPPRTHHRKESIPTTAYPSGSFSGTQPSAPAHMVGGQQSNVPNTKDDHHYGRDAAAGVGIGALGAGVYAHEKSHGAGETPATRYTGSSYPPQSTAYPTTGSQPTATGYTGSSYPPQSTAYPTTSSQPTTTTGVREPTSVPATSYPNYLPQESHKGRDTALAGAAGVGAGAVGAHEYSNYEEQKAAHGKALEEQRKEADRHAKEVERQQKETEKAEKEHAKAVAKEEKHTEKEERKAHEAAVKEEKKAEKEAAKEEARAQKEEKKMLAAEEKEEAEEEKGEKKKHRSLFGFLKRRKNAKGEDEEYESENEDDHTGAKVAGAGAVGAAGAVAGTEAYEATHHHNKLHKDPPLGHPAAAGMDETSGTSPSGYSSAAPGIAAGTPAYGGNSTTYAEPPTKGYATQVTGGTGTTALAQGESGLRGSHATGAANVLDSKLGTQDTTAAEPAALSATKSSGFRDPSDPLKGPRDDPLLPSSSGAPIGSEIPYRTASGQVIEPITGLPVDLSKGDVAGGTGTDGGTMPSLKDRIFHHGSH